tara:strand:+ start:3172 stop:4110 length:939 start_codon:yes stop_codon:yes gene_type:complete
MSSRKVYSTLSQFCEDDDRPRKVLLQAGFEVHENPWGRRIQSEEMFDALSDVDAVLAAVEPYDEKLLTSLSRLRCISRCGIGTDAIDLATAQRLNISVLTTPDEVVEPVAQLTLAMMLALARNFPLHIEDFRNGTWRKYSGCLLSELTVGLVGFGRIGRAVERYLRQFQPRVIVADPCVDFSTLPSGVKMRSLRELLSEADLVSLHASCSPQNKSPLIGREEIAVMKKASRLINTSRGSLVDEKALYDALQSGHLSGAAFDVFSKEPYSGPLALLPQVLCTPHIATLTRASRAAMELSCAMNVVKFFKREFV